MGRERWGVNQEVSGENLLTTVWKLSPGLPRGQNLFGSREDNLILPLQGWRARTPHTTKEKIKHPRLANGPGDSSHSVSVRTEEPVGPLGKPSSPKCLLTPDSASGRIHVWDVFSPSMGPRCPAGEVFQLLCQHCPSTHFFKISAAVGAWAPDVPPLPALFPVPKAPRWNLSICDAKPESH